MMRTMSKLFCWLLSLIPAITMAQPFDLSLGEKNMPVGAYYYPEHWKSTQWERDIRRMAELGFSFTHYAEFAWSNLEPEEGKYDFAWLDTCVNLAAKYGLKVIMCTPTPTPPAWLTAKHPEIRVVNEEGRAVHHGTRLHANGAHPVYQRYIEKLLLNMAARYGNHPAIWGWQLDNEPHFASLYDYSDFAQAGFRKWLEKKYGTISNLNAAWGGAFWSFSYNDFGQIRIPNDKETGGSNPHALLDFRRFTADMLADALRFQSDLLRRHVSNKQWITTNYAYYKFLPSVDLFRSRNDLDFASHTMYLLSTVLNYPAGPLAHRLGSGMELAFSSELARSIKGYTGIMELQPGQINWGQWNSQPLPGAVRMWIWHSYGLGDRFVCTYRFRQPLFGGEQFHKGIMEPDGVTVAPGGQEYVQAIREINNLPRLTEAEKVLPREVQSRSAAFLWKQDNLMGMEVAKHNSRWDTWQHYYIYYQKMKTMGVPVTFLQESDSFDVKKYPFLVAPAYEMVDSPLVSKLRRYAAAGGTLILSTRTGMKDNNGHLWEALLQQPIWSLIGARVEYYDHLPAEQKGSILMQGKQYGWHLWGDVLRPEGKTEVLATHADQFYAGKPVVVRNRMGKGMVYYLGAQSTDGSLEEAVLRKAWQDAGASILQLPDYVFIDWRDGFYVAVNYSSATYSIPLQPGQKMILGQQELAPGGVAVFR